MIKFVLLALYYMDEGHATCMATCTCKVNVCNSALLYAFNSVGHCIYI